MRIAFISDTHCGHEEVIIPKCDLVIHCGDATYMGREDEIIGFNEWIGTLKTPFVFISGNHDWLFQTNRKRAEQLLYNAIYLEDSSVTIKGIEIYGSPYTPEFCSWAFNLSRFGTELFNKWNSIPEDTDILVTHGPPLRILDEIPLRGHLGCYDLAERLKHISPKIHGFGHIHGAYGKKKIRKTTFINCSIMDEQYNITNKPILINI